MTTTAHPAASSSPATPNGDNRISDRQLRRLRWAVRATLALGVAASVAANVLHAQPNPISQIIAAWPPLALLLTVELISRVPHHRWYLGAIRVTAATVIAVIAAWVSYWHLVGVAARQGETGYGAAYLLPISVDGLVIIASVSLVEISAGIRVTPTHAAPEAATEHATAPAPAALDPLTPTFRNVPRSPARAGEVAVAAYPPSSTLRDPEHTPPVPGADRDDVPAPPPAHEFTAEQRAPDPARAANNSSRDHGIGLPRSPLSQTASPVRDTMTLPSSEAALPASSAVGPGAAPTPAEPAAPPPAAGTSGHGRADPPDDEAAQAALADTATAVAYWRRRDPTLQPADVAARIGRSARTVRRHWHQRATNRTAHVKGQPTGKGRR